MFASLKLPSTLDWFVVPSSQPMFSCRVCSGHRTTLVALTIGHVRVSFLAQALFVRVPVLAFASNVRCLHCVLMTARSVPVLVPLVFLVLLVLPWPVLSALQDLYGNVYGQNSV